MERSLVRVTLSANREWVTPSGVGARMREGLVKKTKTAKCSARYYGGVGIELTEGLSIDFALDAVTVFDWFL